MVTGPNTGDEKVAHCVARSFLLCGEPSRTSPQDIAIERGAGDRGRTGTALSGHRILSPVRMPVSPLRHRRPQLARNLTSGSESVKVGRQTQTACAIPGNRPNADKILEAEAEALSYAASIAGRFVRSTTSFMPDCKARLQRVACICAFLA